MQTRPPYLLSGSFAYDTILRHGALFQARILPEAVAKLNVCFDIDSVKNELGGAGGNIAYNASLLSQSPMLVGTLGGDAAQYLAWLDKNGLDSTTLALVPDEGCAHAWITSDASGNQITAFSRGAMVRPVQLPQWTPNLWHLGPEHPANTARLALAAIDQGKSFLFDRYKEFAIARCKIKTGYISGKGEFFENIKELPPAHNLMSVFRVGVKTANALRQSRE